MTAVMKKLAQGDVSIGTWLSTTSAEVMDGIASLGIDWVVIDMEHGAAGLAEAEACVIAAERNGCEALARIPNEDPYLARRLLDIGVHGLVIPKVEDLDTFQEFVSHLFYPPKGKRGVALGRFNRWGETFDDYMSDFKPLIVPQIESYAGVQISTELAAMAAVDALFLGPYDLSADLGTPGDFTTDAFTSALNTVLSACASHGAAPGIHQVKPDPAELRGRLNEGYRFVAYATDIIAMRSVLSDISVIQQER